MILPKLNIVRHLLSLGERGRCAQMKLFLDYLYSLITQNHEIFSPKGKK